MSAGLGLYWSAYATIAAGREETWVAGLLTLGHKSARAKHRRTTNGREKWQCRTAVGAPAAEGRTARHESDEPRIDRTHFRRSVLRSGFHWRTNARHATDSGLRGMARRSDGRDAACTQCILNWPNVELSGRRRQDARPGLATMYRVPPDRAWRLAVGAPLERRVRPVLRHGRYDCCRPRNEVCNGTADVGPQLSAYRRRALDQRPGEVAVPNNSRCAGRRRTDGPPRE